MKISTYESEETRHGAEVGPGPRDPGTWDPLQSLKMEPGTPPLSFKSGTPGSLQSLKVGPLHLTLMNTAFLEHFIFFYLLNFFK